jgi:hypothetical protein
MIALATSPPQRNPIHLTDTCFETSQIVEIALDIIYTLDFYYQSSDYGLDDFQSLIDFAKKWEISMIDKIIQKEMWRDVNSKSGPTWPFDNFLIALKLGNNELAATYYATHERDVRGRKPLKGDPKQYHLNLVRVGLSTQHSLLDGSSDEINILGMMSLDAFLHISQPVVWVILRAQLLQGNIGSSGKDIIRTLLDLICKRKGHKLRVV